MKKTELLKLLAQFNDDDEILVEKRDGGFDDPVLYVTAVCARPASEFVNAFTSQYASRMETRTFGAVILGTTDGIVQG